MRMIFTTMVLVGPLRERLERAHDVFQRAGATDKADAIRFALDVLADEESYYASNRPTPTVRRFRLSEWVGTHINPLTNERKRR